MGQPTVSNSEPGLRGLIWRYCAGFGAVWLLVNLALFAFETRGLSSDPSGTLLQKTRYYAGNASDYDMVFLGDSRTYCAMHPDLIDPKLGTRSINLARWAHWFPTQYAQFQDLLPDLAPGTVVVWSVGHQNFNEPGAKLHTAYPVGLNNVPLYLQLGFQASSMSDNLLFYNPATTLVGWLPQIRSSVDARLERRIWQAEHPTAERGATDASLTALLDRVEASALTARWELRVDAGANTSLAVEKTNGAYERIEIDRDYFRRKQRESEAELTELAGQVDDAAAFEPVPEYWALFLKMLDLFEEHQVRLVVNELEEAPYVYLTDSRRRQLRGFMRDRVAPEVRRRGFDYLRVDFDRLTDEDYFDYNHLNSQGIQAFTEMFARELQTRTHGMASTGAGE